MPGPLGGLSKPPGRPGGNTTNKKESSNPTPSKKNMPQTARSHSVAANLAKRTTPGIDTLRVVISRMAVGPKVGHIHFFIFSGSGRTMAAARA